MDVAVLRSLGRFGHMLNKIYPDDDEIRELADIMNLVATTIVIILTFSFLTIMFFSFLVLLVSFSSVYFPLI